MQAPTTYVNHVGINDNVTTVDPGVDSLRNSGNADTQRGFEVERIDTKSSLKAMFDELAEMEWARWTGRLHPTGLSQFEN